MIWGVARLRPWSAENTGLNAEVLRQAATANLRHMEGLAFGVVFPPSSCPGLLSGFAEQDSLGPCVEAEALRLTSLGLPALTFSYLYDAERVGSRRRRLAWSCSGRP